VKIPSLEEALSLLAEAEKCNPGPWVRHSLFAAQAAQAIASHHPELHPENAYVLGYLHDIGRREGVTGMQHVLDGYHFLMKKGYDDAARICLTHSFPVKKVEAVEGKWNCPVEELAFIQDHLDRMEYDDYDKLIQLCDAMALPSGYCLVEKRFVDVALRHGMNQYTLPRWKAYLNLQIEFEEAIDMSIYACLPGIVKNTFGVNLSMAENQS
jgi:hypothetical protein